MAWLTSAMHAGFLCGAWMKGIGGPALPCLRNLLELVLLGSIVAVATMCMAGCAARAPLLWSRMPLHGQGGQRQTLLQQWQCPQHVASSPLLPRRKLRPCEASGKLLTLTLPLLPFEPSLMLSFADALIA